MAIPLAYNLRNLRVRFTTTVMTALGVALTVAVLLGILALVNGLAQALAVTGHPRQILVLRQGATSELVSAVTEEQYQALETVSGIERLEGEPLISHEIVSVIALPLRGDPTQEGNVSARGISPVGIRMREDARIVEGRWFDPGKYEMVVGRGLHEIRGGTDLGDVIEFGRGRWTVVGVFDAGGSAYGSELWCDANLAAEARGMRGAWNSVLVRGESAAATQTLLNRVQDDQRLRLQGQLESEYYAKQMSTAGPVQALGMFVAAIMAVGSSFAAMNTMYTAVARRSREIGTLRLLGFSRGSIMTSFLIESLSLALLGGALGCLLTLPLNGLEGRLGNQVTFSDIAFSFRVTPESLALGLAFAAIMGVVGGLLPARLAASRSVLSSMRDL